MPHLQQSATGAAVPAHRRHEAPTPPAALQLPPLPPGAHVPHAAGTAGRLAASRWASATALPAQLTSFNTAFICHGIIYTGRRTLAAMPRGICMAIKGRCQPAGVAGPAWRPRWQLRPASSAAPHRSGTAETRRLRWHRHAHSQGYRGLGWPGDPAAPLRSLPPPAAWPAQVTLSTLNATTTCQSKGMTLCDSVSL